MRKYWKVKTMIKLSALTYGLTKIAQGEEYQFCKNCKIRFTEDFDFCPECGGTNQILTNKESEESEDG